MAIQKLPNQIDIIGDDLPYNTQWYRKVPTGFGFDALDYPTDKPLTLALKDKLNAFANDYYRNYEIVGTTYADFQVNLQIALLENVDTFEKMLEVYDDDIAKPLQSRTIIRTYDITDITDGKTTDKGNTTVKGSISGSATDTNTGTVGSDITNIDYDLPIDNPNGQATSKSVGTGTTTNNLTNSQSSEQSSNQTNEQSNEQATNNTFTHKGTEKEDWSDVGVAPNYTLLNGFLDNNRSYYNVFVNFFTDCFTLMESYYG